MKRLIDVGYIEKGMVLVDKDNKQATITDVQSDIADPQFCLVQVNNSENLIMWDWSRVRDDLMVKEVRM